MAGVGGGGGIVVGGGLILSIPVAS